MKPPLEYGKYYHIYNRGNNYENIFVENSDYQHFLKIYDIYIHNNLVKHGFVEHTIEYPWTSYLSIISRKPTKINREELISYFEDIGNFKFLHKRSVEENDNRINDLIIE